MKRDGFLPLQREVKVAWGKSQDVDVRELAMVPASRNVLFITQPPAVEVELRGTTIGQQTYRMVTPDRIHVEAGDYTIHYGRFAESTHHEGELIEVRGNLTDAVVRRNLFD
jgi:hypothetical protein